MVQLTPKTSMAAGHQQRQHAGRRPHANKMVTIWREPHGLAVLLPLAVSGLPCQTAAVYFEAKTKVLNVRLTWFMHGRMTSVPQYS